MRPRLPRLREIVIACPVAGRNLNLLLGLPKRLEGEKSRDDWQAASLPRLNYVWQMSMQCINVTAWCLALPCLAR